MNTATHIIALPVLAGLVLLLFPGGLRLKATAASAVSLVCVFWAILFFSAADYTSLLPGLADRQGAEVLSLSADSLSKFILLCMSILAALISIYALSLKTAGLSERYWPIISCSS